MNYILTLNKFVYSDTIFPMEHNDITHNLNEHQNIAVNSKSKHIRVVAGAGSGKTKVLTCRIAHLISDEHVLPYKILAITFTNKVANEMKTRVEKLCPNMTNGLLIKTFHSLANYFLRREIGVLHYPASFTILDEDDTKSLIKNIAVEMGYSKGDSIIKNAISYISNKKNHEILPDDIVINPHSRIKDEKDIIEIYRRYEEEKRRQFALDFDDLLLFSNTILESNPLIRARWQNRFNHILIDEFQDTNDVEYRFIKFLLNDDTNLFVVGDPDQTIYTWRGANQKIILDMNKVHSDIETVILDRNYRSTQKILNSANNLISNNKFRVKKDLYTSNNEGANISVKSFNSSKEEADYVARTIRDLNLLEKIPFHDISVLYRSAYITLDFETAFMKYKIPYVIYGGLKFYQRKEIKDVFAYFRLLNTKNDDISFERIINVPRRGIGDTSLKNLKVSAKENNMSLYDFVCSDLAEKSSVPKRVINSLRSLIIHLDNCRDKINSDDELLSKLLEDFLVSINYYEYLMGEENGEERIENVKALLDDLKNFLKANPDAKFDEYLQNAALVSAQDEMIDGDKVMLMTVHTAKGLEFPIVFIVRFNDGVFPNYRAINEGGYESLEEERRLAYVAITRAKEKLYITYTRDYNFVINGYLSASCFISEAKLNETVSESQINVKKENPVYIPPSNYDFEIKNNKEIKPVIKEEIICSNGLDWEVGDVAIHKVFGKGKVVAIQEKGIIKILFDNHGLKTLLGSHKALSKEK